MRKIENHMYTTIPPELETPLTELEKHEHLDLTQCEIEDYEKKRIIEAFLEEEEYFEELVETEPQQEEA